MHHSSSQGSNGKKVMPGRKYDLGPDSYRD
jgi:hypothetical protein